MIDPAKHIGLVRRVARGYRWACSSTLELADLEQEGMQGVIRAARTFDPERGAFSTYAMPWIKHFVQRAVHNQCRTVRVPMPVSKREWSEGRPVSLTTTSLDEKPWGDSGSASMADLLGFITDAQGPLNIEESERKELVAHLLSTLSEREALVLRLRFFEDLTLHEVGRRIGTTKERARQLQANALARISGRLRMEAAE